MLINLPPREERKYNALAKKSHCSSLIKLITKSYNLLRRLDSYAMG